jgi:signal transduction histidine kinase
MKGSTNRGISELRSRVRRPRWSIRLKLTVFYGALFLVAGVAVLGITYLLVHHSTARLGVVNVKGDFQIRSVTARDIPPDVARRIAQLPTVSGPPPRLIQAAIDRQRATAIHQLLVESGIALGIGTLLSMALGWFMAGRALRPVRTMTATVRTISAENLHERLAPTGPNDEIKELGETFDGLLARLEASFEAQRRFVANASHELRSPLARQRTLVEVSLRDPAPTVESLRATQERVLAAGDQQERLTESLLTLARSERGFDATADVDLADVARRMVDARTADAQARGLTVDVALEPASTLGDTRLIERLVANLVDNATVHNVTGGSVHVSTARRNGEAVLRVTNTGPVVPGDQVEGLFEPFRRLHDRIGHGEGFGLGLSIVRAIADAHGADLVVGSPPEGGLAVEVTFPARPVSA